MATREELRRALGDDISEPFFEQITDGYFNCESATASTVVVSAAYARIWNKDDFWNKSTIYNASTGEERRIYDFNVTTRTASVAPDWGTTPTSAHELEIHTRATAKRKHDAINKVLRESYDYFYQLQEREVVIPINTSEMTSSHYLPTTWRKLLEVHLEPHRNMNGTHEATAVTATTITVADAGWTVDGWVDYDIALVSGAGAGQRLVVTSNTADTLTFASTSIALAVGDKFYLKEERKGGTWQPIDDVLPMGGKLFNSLLLPRRLQYAPGRTLRLRGMLEPAALATDDAETDVPEDYIRYAAASYLTLRKIHKASSHTTGDEERIGSWDDQKAQQALKRLAFDAPDEMLWRYDSRGWSVPSVFD